MTVQMAVQTTVQTTVQMTAPTTVPMTVQTTVPMTVLTAAPTAAPTAPAPVAPPAAAMGLTAAVVVGGLFAVGLHLLLQRSLMRLLFGFLVLGHGTNLLVLLAAGPPGRPPITGEGEGAAPFADPLPQAMALTAIVITFGVTVLLLALLHRGWQLLGHAEVRDDVEDRRLGEGPGEEVGEE